MDALFLVLIIFLSINLFKGHVITNTLTNIEYNNIEISDVFLIDIESVNGDFNEMRNLFGVANNIIETGSEIGELHRKFINIKFKM